MTDQFLQCSCSLYFPQNSGITVCLFLQIFLLLHSRSEGRVEWLFSSIPAVLSFISGENCQGLLPKLLLQCFTEVEASWSKSVNSRVDWHWVQSTDEANRKSSSCTIKMQVLWSPLEGSTLSTWQCDLSFCSNSPWWHGSLCKLGMKKKSRNLKKPKTLNSCMKIFRLNY